MTTTKTSRRTSLALVPKSNNRVSLLDLIDDQIRFARGIDFAVMGVAGIEDFDSSEISTLFDAHIARLEAIRDQIENLAVQS